MPTPMAPAMVTTADRGTATMAAMPPLITEGTPQRITEGTPQRPATLQHTTAGMDRVTMLPPITVPGTGAHTTALGTIAGIKTAGDRQVRR